MFPYCMAMTLTKGMTARVWREGTKAVAFMQHKVGEGLFIASDPSAGGE